MAGHLLESAGAIHRFIFLSDIAGSSRLAEAFPQEYQRVLAEHNALTEQAVTRYGGSVYKHTGDGYIALFESPRGCTACAAELAVALKQIDPPAEGEPLSVRIALHAGELKPSGSEYFGPALNRLSRICQVCSPGQVLLSSVVTAALGKPQDGLLLHDLGEHYLRDLAEPEHLYQLDYPGFAQHDFPPLSTLNNHPNNLVRQPNHFIGREKELRELEQLLLADENLITIIAPGGYGKSRLAAQLCANLLHSYEHGAFMAYLAPLRNAIDVPGAIAGALGYQFTAGRTPEQQLCDFLRTKELMLCLDNLEHLLDCAPLVAQLIQAAPRLRIIVTAREPLRIEGEQIYRLEPLPVSSEGGELYSEAQRLFADRATLVNSTFTLNPVSAPRVQQICAQLSGIPLAIELAAAWMDGFTLPELHDELSHQLELEARTSDKPARHHSLKACLDWSWNLLGPQQQELLMRCSVFRGGFFSEAGTAVLGLTGMALRTALLKLCDKSWLYTREADGHTRFYLRDALAHEYASTRLQETRGPADSLDELAMRAHASHFAALVEREGPRLSGGGTPDGGAAQKGALRTWRIELENINEALDCAMKRGDLPWSLSILEHLQHYLSTVGEFISMRERYTGLLEVSIGLSSAEMQLQAQTALAVAYRQLGIFSEARVAAVRAIELAEQLGNRHAMAGMLFDLGVVELFQDNYSLSRSFLTRAIELCRELGYRSVQAYSLNNLAIVERMLGNYVTAQELHQQSLALMREMGDRRGEGNGLHGLGVVEDFQGNITAAIACFEQALAISCELGTQLSQANTYNSLAIEEEQLGNWSAAGQHYMQSLTIKRELGDRKGEAITLSGLGRLQQLRGNYGGARDYLTQALVLNREIGSLSGECNCLFNLAAAEFDDGKYAQAGELASQARQMANQIGKKREAAYSQQLIAAIEARQGDAGTALLLASKALKLHCELGDKLSVARCCTLIGALLARLGQYREAALALGGLKHFAGSPALAQDAWAIDEAQALLEAAAGADSTAIDELAQLKEKAGALSIDELAEHVLAVLGKQTAASGAE